MSSSSNAAAVIGGAVNEVKEEEAAVGTAKDVVVAAVGESKLNLKVFLSSDI